MAMKDIYHEWKSNGCRFDALDGPHKRRTYDLDEGEDVNPQGPHVTQVDVIRLIFRRHQHRHDAIDELEDNFIINSLQRTRQASAF